MWISLFVIQSILLLVRILLLPVVLCCKCICTLLYSLKYNNNSVVNTSKDRISLITVVRQLQGRKRRTIQQYYQSLLFTIPPRKVTITSSLLLFSFFAFSSSSYTTNPSRFITSAFAIRFDNSNNHNNNFNRKNSKSSTLSSLYLLLKPTITTTTTTSSSTTRNNIPRQQQQQKNGIMMTTTPNNPSNTEGETNSTKSSLIVADSTPNNNNNNNNITTDDSNNSTTTLDNSKIRIKSAIIMSIAMSLHYGGYEFVRNSILALFTSSTIGFTSSGAYPLANGLISPFSLLLLYLYGIQLSKNGPQYALSITTLSCIIFIAFTSSLLFVLTSTGNNTALLIASKLGISSSSINKKLLCQFIIGISFLFQNTYNYLIATQQWSFVNSILTPTEGIKYFTLFTGVTSLICTIIGTIVPYIIPYTGLLGLYSLTCITLYGTYYCQNYAYNIATQYGFNPTSTSTTTTTTKSKDDSTTQKLNDDTISTNSSTTKQELSLTKRGYDVFKRIPILRILFVEVISFQSLNTILTILFVNTLKNTISNDNDRGAYSSKFYSLINGSSAILQFFILPYILKHVQPKTIWKCMPIIPFIVCTYQIVLLILSATSTATTTTTALPLTLLAFALYVTKTMDYSIRSVVYNMVYQPLDFDSRYIGKEIIGVLGSRFGKSGMSIIIGIVSFMGYGMTYQLSYVSWILSTTWIVSTWSLSSLLPTKEQAQIIVEQRISNNSNSNNQSEQQPSVEEKKNKKEM